MAYAHVVVLVALAHRRFGHDVRVARPAGGLQVRGGDVARSAALVSK